MDIKAIARTLDISKNAVEEKIEKLYLSDMVYRSAEKYYTFNDICLMRFIKFVYEKDLEGIEAVDLSQQNLFNTLKGRFLEIVVQVTMMKFNHENLPGKFFGTSGDIQVPLFQVVDTKYVKGLRTRQYQIDVWGQEQGTDRCWICECKYTKTKMGMKQVEKLRHAARALKQEAEDAGRRVPHIQMWLISTGGFTQEVLKYVRDQEETYLSDYDGINGIFRAYGGNYTIPVFNET